MDRQQTRTNKNRQVTAIWPFLCSFPCSFVSVNRVYTRLLLGGDNPVKTRPLANGQLSIESWFVFRFSLRKLLHDSCKRPSLTCHSMTCEFGQDAWAVSWPCHDTSNSNLKEKLERQIAVRYNRSQDYHGQTNERRNQTNDRCPDLGNLPFRFGPSVRLITAQRLLFVQRKSLDKIQQLDVSNRILIHQVITMDSLLKATPKLNQWSTVGQRLIGGIWREKIESIVNDWCMSG